MFFKLFERAFFSRSLEKVKSIALDAVHPQLLFTTNAVQNLLGSFLTLYMALGKKNDL